MARGHEGPVSILTPIALVGAIIMLVGVWAGREKKKD